MAKVCWHWRSDAQTRVGEHRMLILLDLALLATGADKRRFLFLRRLGVGTGFTRWGWLAGGLNLDPLGMPALSSLEVILIGSRTAR